MITRKMQVEERNERLAETTFELRQRNTHCDDRMTVVVKAGEETPAWTVGSYVTVTIEEAK